MEKCTFSTFTHVHQIGPYNFLCVHFLQLFQPFWNQHKILGFLISYLFFSRKIFWGLISTLKVVTNEKGEALGEVLTIIC